MLLRNGVLLTALNLCAAACVAQAPTLDQAAKQVLQPPPNASADLQKQLLAHTEALFAAFRDRDLIGFMQGVTADFTYVGPEGVLATEDLAATVQGCSLRTYSVLEPQLLQPSPETAVLIYRHRQDAACNGKKKPAELIGTDHYVRRNGRWLISLHTETVPD